MRALHVILGSTLGTIALAKVQCLPQFAIFIPSNLEPDGKMSDVDENDYDKPQSDWLPRSLKQGTSQAFTLIQGVGSAVETKLCSLPELNVSWPSSFPQLGSTDGSGSGNFTFNTNDIVNFCQAISSKLRVSAACSRSFLENTTLVVKSKLGAMIECTPETVSSASAHSRLMMGNISSSLKSKLASLSLPVPALSRGGKVDSVPTSQIVVQDNKLEKLKSTVASFIPGHSLETSKPSLHPGVTRISRDGIPDRHFNVVLPSQRKAVDTLVVVSCATVACTWAGRRYFARHPSRMRWVNETRKTIQSLPTLLRRRAQNTFKAVKSLPSSPAVRASSVMAVKSWKGLKGLPSSPAGRMTTALAAKGLTHLKELPRSPAVRKSATITVTALKNLPQLPPIRTTSGFVVKTAKKLPPPRVLGTSAKKAVGIVCVSSGKALRGLCVSSGKALRGVCVSSASALGSMKKLPSLLPASKSLPVPALGTTAGVMADSLEESDRSLTSGDENLDVARGQDSRSEDKELTRLASEDASAEVSTPDVTHSASATTTEDLLPHEWAAGAEVAASAPSKASSPPAAPAASPGDGPRQWAAGAEVAAAAPSEASSPPPAAAPEASPGDGPRQWAAGAEVTAAALSEASSPPPAAAPAASPGDGPRQWVVGTEVAAAAPSEASSSPLAATTAEAASPGDGPRQWAAGAEVTAAALSEASSPPAGATAASPGDGPRQWAAGAEVAAAAPSEASSPPPAAAAPAATAAASPGDDPARWVGRASLSLDLDESPRDQRRSVPVGTDGPLKWVAPVAFSVPGVRKARRAKSSSRAPSNSQPAPNAQRTEPKQTREKLKREERIRFEEPSTRSARAAETTPQRFLATDMGGSRPPTREAGKDSARPVGPAPSTQPSIPAPVEERVDALVARGGNSVSQDGPRTWQGGAASRSESRKQASPDGPSSSSQKSKSGKFFDSTISLQQSAPPATSGALEKKYQYLESMSLLM